MKHIFADASEKATAASAYLHTIDREGNGHVGFLIGKAKLAPQSGNTIPRLELCAAVLASGLETTVSENFYILPESIKYYSDSKVVLGYLNNITRRFHTYVSNRVDRENVMLPKLNAFFCSALIPELFTSRVKRRMVQLIFLDSYFPLKVRSSITFHFF